MVDLTINRYKYNSDIRYFVCDSGTVWYRVSDILDMYDKSSADAILKLTKCFCKVDEKYKTYTTYKLGKIYARRRYINNAGIDELDKLLESERNYSIDIALVG